MARPAVAGGCRRCSWVAGIIRALSAASPSWSAFSPGRWPSSSRRTGSDLLVDARAARRLLSPSAMVGDGGGAVLLRLALSRRRRPRKAFSVDGCSWRAGAAVGLSGWRLGLGRALAVRRTGVDRAVRAGRPQHLGRRCDRACQGAWPAGGRRTGTDTCTGSSRWLWSTSSASARSWMASLPHRASSNLCGRGSQVSVAVSCALKNTSSTSQAIRSASNVTPSRPEDDDLEQSPEAVRRKADGEGEEQVVDRPDQQDRRPAQAHKGSAPARGEMTVSSRNSVGPRNRRLNSSKVMWSFLSSPGTESRHAKSRLTRR